MLYSLRMLGAILVMAGGIVLVSLDRYGISLSQGDDTLCFVAGLVLLVLAGMLFMHAFMRSEIDWSRAEVIESWIKSSTQTEVIADLIQEGGPLRRKDAKRRGRAYLYEIGYWTPKKRGRK